MSHASRLLDQLLLCSDFTKNEWEKVYRLIYSIGASIHFPDDIAKFCTRLVDMIAVFYTDNLDLLNLMRIPQLLEFEEKLLSELSKAYNVRISDSIANCDIDVNIESVCRLHRIWHSIPFANQRSYLSDFIHFAYCLTKCRETHKCDKVTQDHEVDVKQRGVDVEVQADRNEIDYAKRIQPLLESCMNDIVDPLQTKITSAIKHLRKNVNADRNLLKSSKTSVVRFRKRFLKHLSSKIDTLGQILHENTSKRDQHLYDYIESKIECLTKVQEETMCIDEAGGQRYNDEDDDDSANAVTRLSTKINFLGENIASVLEQLQAERKERNHQQIVEDVAIAAIANESVDTAQTHGFMNASFLNDNRLKEHGNYEHIFSYVTKRMQSKAAEIKNADVVRSVLCEYFFETINCAEVLLTNFDVLVTLEAVNHNVQCLTQNGDLDSLISKHKDKEYNLQYENFKLKETIVTLEQSVINANEKSSELTSEIVSIKNAHDIEVKNYLCQINELINEVNKRKQSELTSDKASKDDLSQSVSLSATYDNSLKNAPDKISQTKDAEKKRELQIDKIKAKNRELSDALAKSKSYNKTLKSDLRRARLKMENSQKSLQMVRRLQRQSSKRLFDLVSKSNTIPQNIVDKLRTFESRRTERLDNVSPLDTFESQRKKPVVKRKLEDPYNFIDKGIPLLIDKQNQMQSGSEKTIAVETINVIEKEFKRHLRRINKRNACNDMAAPLYENHKDVMLSTFSDIAANELSDVNWKTIIMFLAGKLNWEFPSLSFQKFVNTERDKLSKLFKRKQCDDNSVTV